MEESAKLPTFDCSGTAAEVSQRWKQWYRSFRYMAEAKDISSAKRLKSLLLHSAGTEVQELFEDLVDPKAGQVVTNDSDFKRCVRTLEHHFKAASNPIFERHSFRQMTFIPGETMSQFVVRLRQQARLCEFDDNADDMIRDQVVSCVTDVELKKKLLENPNLTLAMCLETARLHEATKIQASAMAGPAHVYSLSQKSARGSEKNQSAPRTGPRLCYRCNQAGHFANSSTCPARKGRCSKCKKVGHFAECCRTKTVHQLEQESVMEAAQAEEQSYELGAVSLLGAVAGEQTSTPAIDVVVQISGQRCTMELDTGAEVSVIPSATWHSLFPDVTLQPSNAKLTTYGREALTVLGERRVEVAYRNQYFTGTAIVVEGEGRPLFGRNWLKCIKLDWPSLFKNIHAVNTTPYAGVADMFAEFPSVFADGLGTVKGFEAEIHLRDGAVPKCCPVRSIPYAIREAVDNELDRLESEGIITPVKSAEWASPLVVVSKKNGDIRLCADFKVSINPHIDAKQHPIPNPNDLLSQIADGSIFSTLDLSQAYAQLPLSEASKKYCIITTHRGLYAYQRLPFGVASAPAIWQQTMDTILQGLDGVVCFYDDVLICGKDAEEHDRRLKLVLARLEEYGVRLRREKCVLRADKVRYLGYTISGTGLETNDDKVEAIVNAPVPTDVTSLQSFLGCVNFYNRFLPDVSSVLKPLNSLLRKGAQWDWSHDCQKAFTRVKDMLVQAPVLAHFDVTQEVVVECDASPHGIGACLSHTYPDGSRRPVCFVSRSLSSAESHYSQIEREALAIVFAVKRLHIYLYGRSFVLKTDHKPLLKIFGEKSGLSGTAVSRLQRWAVILSEYTYSIEHISGSQNVVADCLSRLPLKLTDAQERAVVNAVSDNRRDPCIALPVTAADVAAASKSDDDLSKVMQYLQFGWPTDINESIRSYHRCRSELTIEADCLVREHRTVIPVVFRRHLLEDLHSVHIGVCRMKSVARSFFWWPGIDADIELLASTCAQCLQVAKAPPKDAPHHWIYPSEAFERIHIDFAEYAGSHYLVLVDAYSKWVDVYPMGKDTTAMRTVDHLLTFLATFGIPKCIVSDNGPQFTSAVFGKFCKENGIVHKCTPPYHPASNGQVERIVQEFKKSMKTRPSNMSERTQVQRFLCMYRNTPQSTTHATPASLIFKRLPTTKFSFLKPSFAAVQRSQQDDVSTANREFLPADSVLVLNTRNGSSSKWSRGVVMQRLGPLSYAVQLGEHTRHVHIDHLKPYVTSDSSTPPSANHSLPMRNSVLFDTPTVHAQEPSTPSSDVPAVSVAVSSADHGSSLLSAVPAEAVSSACTNTSPTPSGGSIRPIRSRCPPERLIENS